MLGTRSTDRVTANTHRAKAASTFTASLVIMVKQYIPLMPQEKDISLMPQEQRLYLALGSLQSLRKSARNR